MLSSWGGLLHTLPSPVHQPRSVLIFLKHGRLHVILCSETFHELLLSKSPTLVSGSASHFPSQHSANGSAS